MKTKIINLSFILVLLLSGTTVFSQVGIGTTTPNTSSMLDVDVSALPAAGKKGFLPPRMAEADRNLIGSPAKGLLIYNTTTNQLNYYNGAWQVIDNAAGDYVNFTDNQLEIGGDKTFTGTLTPAGRLMLPMGELSYFSMAGFPITFADQSNGTSSMVPINPPTSIAGEFEFVELSDGILQYTGESAKMFHIAVTISGTPAQGKDVFVFGVAKGGTVITSGKVLGSSSGTQFSSLHIMLMLSKNETLQLFMGNTSAARGFTVKSLNFFAMGV